MFPDRSYYVPFALPMWGFNQLSNGRQLLAIDNHINFMFHTNDGYIIGAGAYPFRDRFELAEVGSTVHLHGAVRWFLGHKHEPLVGRGLF